MAAPSTEWRETVASDEVARFAGYAEQFVQMQKRKSAKFGNGRALHRKQLLALHATLEVLPDLPAHARHGLFGHPGSYDAWVRLSNGGTDRARDATPDIRGFAIKVRGVRATRSISPARKRARRSEACVRHFGDTTAPCGGGDRADSAEHIHRSTHGTIQRNKAGQSWRA